MVNELFNEIHKELVPSASYFQNNWLMASSDKEGRLHGFSSETAIAIVASIIVGSFFKSFFEEFGKIAAANLLKKIIRKIAKREKDVSRGLNKIKEIVDANNITVYHLDRATINIINRSLNNSKNEIITLLTRNGFSDRKADIVTKAVCKIINDQMTSTDNNAKRIEEF